MTRFLEVLRPGLLSSVQDVGRLNHRAEGIAACGALDPLALAAANVLAGNAREAAAIEITMGNAAFRFSTSLRFALSGAETNATLDGSPIPSWSCATATAGQTLELRAPVSGMRSILAVAGGVDVPQVLDSRSTDLQAAFGGFGGRALRCGDRLAIGLTQVEPPAKFRIKPPHWQFDPHEVGVLPAPERAQFTIESQGAFFDTAWTVTPQSNRMGYRLAGAVLRCRSDAGAMLSAAVFPGVIQVPPSGSPIVLLNDAQTTGGYPRIGVVRESDRWKLAGIVLGAQIRFVPSTLEAAEEAKRHVDRYLDEVEAAVTSRMNSL